MKFRFLILTAIFLVGCVIANPNNQSSAMPLLQFKSPNIFDKYWDSTKGLDLDLGIYAINKNEAFLFGSIDRNSALSFLSAQSALLHSDDGGKHWKEVLNPIKAGTIWDLSITNDGVGWALAYTWDLEEYTLYHTTDHGKNWEQLSVIAAPGNTTFIRMNFVDEFHGDIVILYMGDHIDFLTTADGGVTWISANKYSPPFDDLARTEILETYVSSRRDTSESVSTDYLSDWKLETNSDTLFITRKVIEKNQSWGNWEIINKLPIHLNYQNGQIVVP